MNQLELLWQLEKYNDIIDKCKNKLIELENSIKLYNLTASIKELKFRLNQIEEIKISNNKHVAKLERLLKEYDYTKKELEDNLYNGSITDLKQLEHLTREKNGLLEKIDIIEVNILEMMEEDEKLQEEHNILLHKLKEYDVEIREVKKALNKDIIDMQNRIQDAEKERIDIIPSIDEEILNRYERIRNKRGQGIVLVNNYICSGCNVRIPTYLVKTLRNNDEIIFCESCGRILYYIRQDISSS